MYCILSWEKDFGSQGWEGSSQDSLVQGLVEDTPKVILKCGSCIFSFSLSFVYVCLVCSYLYVCAHRALLFRVVDSRMLGFRFSSGKNFVTGMFEGCVVDPV